MNQRAELTSANDWLKKAGARIEGTRVVLPHQFLCVPLALASEAIVQLRASEQANERIKHALVVALMIRVADTAFYKSLAKIVNEANQKRPNLCQHCLRGQICGTRMRELRKNVNSRIIHKMESAAIVPVEEITIVEKYYEEIFRLPLVDPIQFPNRNISPCPRCLPKYREHNKRFNSDAGEAGAD